MSKIIITSGKNYVDIDALASALALRDLLILEGEDAEAVLAGPLNHSVSPEIKSWGLNYSTELKYLDVDFILVDVSEASHFPMFLNQNRIIKIYDHHFNFADFWKKSIGNKAVIEPVGSCATLIWEEYVKQGKEKQISAINSNLLATAIVSNTLNFNASVTTDRDKAAFAGLQSSMSLGGDWVRRYFDQQEDQVIDDPYQSIVRDTKVQDISNLGFVVVIGQIELWDGSQFTKNHQSVIKDALTSFNQEHWFFSCPSISEGKNYIYAESDKIKEMLKRIIGAKFESNLGETPKLWLRKEIFNKLYQLKD